MRLSLRPLIAVVAAVAAAGAAPAVATIDGGPPGAVEISVVATSPAGRTVTGTCRFNYAPNQSGGISGHFSATVATPHDATPMIDVDCHTDAGLVHSAGGHGT